MAQPPRSIYHQSPPHFWEKTLTHWWSYSYIMAKSCRHWSILSDFRKFLPHWGILCRWSFSEQSPLTVSVPCVFLFSLIFLRFALLAFRLVFPTMAHRCSTDVDDPAFPRATRAHSLGFCCFCFHNLHRVPQKRSRKREKTTLIHVRLFPTFSLLLWYFRIKLLKVVRKSSTKH